MSEFENVLLLGGVETGKTNFLSRLWLAMHKGSGRLQKDDLPDVLDYLESGSQQLLKGEFAGRTPRDSFNKVDIPFRLAIDGKKGRLILPDVSGEDFAKVYSERGWNSEWEECITNCVGCLLFLRDRVIRAPLSWIDAQRLVVGARVGKPSELAKASESDEDEAAPTQTVLVEWLQFISSALLEERGHRFVPRIAIVVAAWDELGDEVVEEGPDAFLKRYTPLLHHYIDTNRDRLLTKVFGVSVVGGDLTHDDEFRERFLNEMNPNESGYVIYELEGAQKKSGDITIPVAWLLGDPLK